MNNLFKKGFASLVLASAMTSSIFAGNAAFISVKVEYVNTFKTDSKDGNVTAFKMHIKEGNLVATFNKDANHANSATIKLAVNERVAGERIESGDILFKKATASNTNLIPNQTDAKVGKLNFAINQTDEANLLIIFAANKQDLVNAMPLNVAVNRIGVKMHLVVTRDRAAGFKKSTTNLFANNIKWDQWNKEKVILGNSDFKKQKAMTPQVNLYSDATESTTDGNMTNANLLIKSNGKGRIGVQANMKLDLKSKIWKEYGKSMTEIVAKTPMKVLDPSDKAIQFTAILDPKDAKIWKEYGKSMITAKAKTGMKLDPNNKKWNNFGNPMLQVNMKLNLKSKTWKEFGNPMITAKVTTNNKNSKISLTPHENLAFKFNRATTGDENSKISLAPHDNNLAFKFSKTRVDQKSKITLEPHSKQLAFKFNRATAGEEKDKIILEPHKLRALNKFLFDSKANSGAASTNMAA